VPAEPSIAALLHTFVADSRAADPAGAERVADAVELLRGCLNLYAYDRLDGEELDRFLQAYEGGDADAFGRLFGASYLPSGIDAFLGYFLLSTVMARGDELRDAAEVMGELVSWLEAGGHLTPADAEVLARTARQAARDLPLAAQASDLLYDEAERVRTSVDQTQTDELVEGNLVVAAVRPGELRFEGHDLLLPVPTAVTDAVRAGWTANLGLLRLGERWYVGEAGTVYPYPT